MTTSSNSQSWSHVASLRPRLKSNAKINRQRFRGELWYVLQDNASGRYHRFSPAANQFIGMMDGRHTVQEIWNLAEQRMGEDVPSQDDVVRLLAQLHGADVLHADVSPDLDELSERQATFRHNTLLQTFRSPLAIRFPLLDPDRLLGATLGWVQPLFSWFGFALWFIVVATGVILAGMQIGRAHV